MSTPKQRQKIYALLHGKGINEKAAQRQIITSFTGGRTGSTREMSHKEASELIRWMTSQPTTRSKSEKMRKKLIHYAHLLGWKRADGKVNMERLNEWCLHYGKHHKRLNDHTYQELVDVLSQFEQMFNSYLKTA